MGLGIWQTVARDQKNCRRVVLEAKVYDPLQCWRRRRKIIKNRGFPVHTMKT
jgi:hypothetical protein